MTRRLSAAALLAATVLAAAGCASDAGTKDPYTPNTLPGGSTTSPVPPTAPASTTVAPAPAPTTGAQPGGDSGVPPLGPDLHCMDPAHCYFQNPKKLTDDQLVAYLKTVPGADAAPAPAMKPWAFVVLGIGENDKLAASSEPSTSGAPVTDQYGILDQRGLFAFCRVAEGGGPVTDSTPRDKVWYQIESPIDTGQPKAWMNGAHLYPYQHNGALPAC